MSGLHSVTLHLDAALDPAQVAGFETVFSELLDAAATSHLRVDGGGWLIEALFTAPPSRAIIEELLAPCFAAAGLVRRGAALKLPLLDIVRLDLVRRPRRRQRP